MKQRFYAWLWQHPRVHLELYELTGYFVMGELPLRQAQGRQRRAGEQMTRFSLHKGR